MHGCTWPYRAAPGILGHKGLRWVYWAAPGRAGLHQVYQAIQGCTGCTGPYRTAWGHMGLHWVYWAIQGCTRQYQAGARAVWGQLPPQPWCHPAEGAAGCWVPPPKPPGAGGLVTPCAALQSPPHAPSQGRTPPNATLGQNSPPAAPNPSRGCRGIAPLLL